MQVPLASRSPRTIMLRRSLMPLLAILVLAVSGCGKSDPATTVTIEITGISDEADRDAVSEKLPEWTDGSGHSMTSSWSNDKMTINLSPVSDVQAFSEQIDFGKVTQVEDRTVKVQFEK
jgi:hypothetical protein